MIRTRVEARDVPAHSAARRLGLSLIEFQRNLNDLILRGFPVPDAVTGNFDLIAIDRWCDARHKHLFGNDPILNSETIEARIKAIATRKKIG